MYAIGRGVPKDDKEAVKWHRLAAEQGHAPAQYMLGVRYYIGEGVPRDYKEAAKWYRLAAEQGDADAQRELGQAQLKLALRYAGGYGGVSKTARKPSSGIVWQQSRETYMHNSI